MFETPKVAGAAYNGFKVQWGAAFAQQFQGLTHSNTADSVFQGASAAVPGNAGAAAVANRNRLQRIGNGFNNAVANAYLHAQLAKGIRIQLTSYLSARHHNETWVKDGFIQIVFVKSCENDADLCTKNVSKDIYNEHVGKFLGKVNEELEKRI
jgi:hypothetical protein